MALSPLNESIPGQGTKTGDAPARLSVEFKQVPNKPSTLLVDPHPPQLMWKEYWKQTIRKLALSCSCLYA